MRPIDADALWLDIANRSACYHDCCPRTKGKGGVLSLIDEAPTIEAEPVRHGRWVNKGDYAVCTECGGRSGTQYDGVEPIPLMTKYCPHCGANMYGKEVKKDG